MSSPASIVSTADSSYDDYYGVAKTCGNCGKQAATFQNCSRCMVTPYCNRVCQRAHWSVHKGECTELALRRGTGGPKASPTSRDEIADKLISDEGIMLSAIFGDDETYSAKYGFMYSRAEKGPFATTSVLVLGVHMSRAREISNQLNSLFTDPLHRRNGLTAGHSFGKAVDAPHKYSQVAILVTPTSATRMIIDDRYVCQTSRAFKLAGSASRVLVYVPLLHSEARAASSIVPVARCPERSALHFRLAKALEASLLESAITHDRLAAPPPPWGRLFGSIASATWRPTADGMLFMNEGCNEIALPLSPGTALTSPQEVVDGMAAGLRTTLYGHFTRLGLSTNPADASSPESRLGWVEFIRICTEIGVQGLFEPVLAMRFGSPVFLSRGAAIGHELQRFFSN